jgi:uncharacterized protein (TIGR02271 family)
MKHTLVAAFDDMIHAQAAKAKLLSANVPAANIQLSSSADTTGADANFAGTTTATAPSATPVHHDESFGDKVSHFFSNLFGNDDDGQPHRHASAYPEAYRRGATLLTVTAANEVEADLIEDILEDNGAIDIDERSSTWTDGVAGSTAGVSHLAGTHQGTHATTPVTAPVSNTLSNDLTGTTAIPVIEESLVVGKRSVDAGKVRVVSRVTERPVEETVSLHEEHATIDRHPVNREATAADLNGFKEGVIEINETREEAVVGKTARVVEEVVVGKAASDRNETVRDTVRRTDVDVEARQGDPLKAAASAERDTPFDKNR